mmetsp:Transcript_22713/g.19734  ORF Transcript_22713/g.19734 Transcript_22713/m.19734 type:complete len:322 (+) Transcript_22713:506-1471(+)
MKIEKLPSFFEYISFVFYYGGCLVGPSYEYKDYSDFIHKRGIYAKYHGFVIPSLVNLFAGFVAMGIVVVFGKTFDIEKMTEEGFKNGYSLIWKYTYLNITMFVQRCRYYSAWLLANANVTVCGFNYDPEAKTYLERYQKISCARPLGVELSTDFRKKMEDWNCSAQYWLRNYIYLRINSPVEKDPKKKKDVMASNVTFLCSAIWHGLYPGYYSAFAQAFLVQQVCKGMFKIKHKFAGIPSILRTIISWCGIICLLNYCAAHMILLDFDKGLKLAASLDYTMTIFIFAGFVYFNFLGGAKGGRKSSKPKEPTEEEMAKLKKE